MPLTISAEKLRQMIESTHDFANCGGEAEEMIGLLAEITAQDKRRMALTIDNMKVMADLSTAQTELARLKALIEQHYRDNDGHNHCFRNNHRLWEGIGLKAKDLGPLPPLDERLHGCAMFWQSLEQEPDRWPDFLGLLTKEGENK